VRGDNGTGLPGASHPAAQYLAAQYLAARASADAAAVLDAWWALLGQLMES
jgi:hypothetical protein